MQRIFGLANYPEGENPLENGSLDNYEVIKMDVTKMTREALKDIHHGDERKGQGKKYVCARLSLLDV